MSTLRSALDELRSEDVRNASEEELGEEDLVELERASRVLEAERARRLVEVERRGSWAVDGHLSVVSWLAARVRVGFGRAGQQVKLSRALRAMPVTSEALGSGEVSSEAVELLVIARDVAPVAFSEAEPMLVEAAGRCLPGGSELPSPTGVRPRMRLGRRSEPGVCTRAATSTSLPPWRERFGSTDRWTQNPVRPSWLPSARCRMPGRGKERKTAGPLPSAADALTELCRAWLDRSDRPQVAGERPHVDVTVDLASLQRKLGQRSELDDTGPITSETARRLACDAGVSRVIMRGAAEPLDVGRKTPVVPSGMRRALVIRDSGCRFPGCGRPHAWCDAHHIEHWADGGETSMGNLVLLCRPHHRAVHEDFRVQMSGHGPLFTRADGSVLAEDRAPP